MSYLILILVFGTAIHFIYESILAPDMRLDLRLQVLEMLDELFLLEQEHADHADRHCFAELDESLNALFESLDRLSLMRLLEIESECCRDPNLRDRVGSQMTSLDRCDVAALRDIRVRSIGIALRAVAINNGGLLFYTLPVALVLLCNPNIRKSFLRLTVQAIDFNQQFGSAHVGMEHDVLSL